MSSTLLIAILIFSQGIEIGSPPPSPTPTRCGAAVASNAHGCSLGGVLT